ncbi:MAG: tyrosine-type recombinase/integrase, partial [Chitinophagales bacterium]
TGSIYQRPDGTWAAQVRMGTDPKTGKPKKKTFYDKDRKKLEEKLRNFVILFEAGEYFECTFTLEEWLNIWLENSKNAYKNTTWDSYRLMAKKHIIPELGGYLLNKITTGHIQVFINDKMNTSGLASRSVRYLIQILNQAFKQAVAERKIRYNPVEAVIQPKLKSRKGKALELEDFEKLMAKIKTSKDRILFITEIMTGLRRGELLGLYKEDLDFNKKLIYITKSLVRTSEGLKLQSPKTESSIRTIPMPELLEEELKKQLIVQEIALNRPMTNKDFVFARQDGYPRDPRGVTKHFQTLIKQAGIEHTTFHDLRHTHSTYMLLEMDIDMKTAQNNLGHSTVETLMNIYSHGLDHKRIEAAAKISDFYKKYLK